MMYHERLIIPIVQYRLSEEPLKKGGMEHQTTTLFMQISKDNINAFSISAGKTETKSSFQLIRLQVVMYGQYQG